MTLIPSPHVAIWAVKQQQQQPQQQQPQQQPQQQNKTKQQLQLQLQLQASQAVLNQRLSTILPRPLENLWTP